MRCLPRKKPATITQTKVRLRELYGREEFDSNCGLGSSSHWPSILWKALNTRHNGIDPLHIMGMQPIWRTKQKTISLLGIEIYSHVKKNIVLSSRLAAFHVRARVYTSPCELVLVCVCVAVKRTMHQLKVDVDKPNVVKIKLADVSSVSPSSEQRLRAFRRYMTKWFEITITFIL